MFDSHCHLDRTGTHAETILARARAAGIENIMIAGVNPTGWDHQLDWVRSGVSIAVGIHPWFVTPSPQINGDHLQKLEDFIGRHRDKIRAVGETGLDFARAKDPVLRTAQQHAFRSHIHHATTWELPLILHAVKAHEPIMAILKSESLPKSGGVVHSFSGSAEMATDYARLGFHVSFSGAITHPNRKRLHAAVAAVPDELLLVETDSPDQTPLNRRPSPNEPAFLIDVISKAALIRNQSPEEIAQITTQNALRLFSP